MGGRAAVRGAALRGEGLQFYEGMGEGLQGNEGNEGRGCSAMRGVRGGAAVSLALTLLLSILAII